MPLGKMTCEEKRLLIGKYGAAVKHYSATVADLNRTRGKILKHEYNQLLELSEEARVMSERTRVALDRHTAEHGC